MQQYVATHDAKLLLLLQLNVSVLFPSTFYSPAVFIPYHYCTYNLHIVHFHSSFQRRIILKDDSGNKASPGQHKFHS